MTEEEAYNLFNLHKQVEHKEHPGVLYCQALNCPFQYRAAPSRADQARRRHWAQLIGLYT